MAGLHFCIKGVEESACVAAQTLVARLGHSTFSCASCTAETTIPNLIVSPSTSDTDAEALADAFGRGRLGRKTAAVAAGRCLHNRQTVDRLCNLSECTAWIDLESSNNCAQVLHAVSPDPRLPVELMAMWLKTSTEETARILSRIQGKLRRALVNDLDV